MLKLQILSANQASKRGLLAEHGLSLWIEKDDKKILFDTGQSSVYSHNAKLLGIDLSEADDIILSHGHYDHCGGLENFPQAGKLPKVYAHPDLFLKRYALNENGTSREIGVPWEFESLAWLSEKLVYNKQRLLIEEGITLSGEIPSSNTFEEVSNSLFVEKEGKRTRDMFLDEQMLIIEEGKGIAIFLGCSHPGVVNCLKYARKLFPEKEILLLVAGMHLENASPIRLQITIQNILDMGIQKLVPLHCTGFTAMCEMKRFLGDRCQICAVGDCIKL